MRTKMNTLLLHGPLFKFEAHGEAHQVALRVIDVLERQILALKPGTSEYAHENGGCINGYLFRLAAIIEVCEKNGISSGIELVQRVNDGIRIDELASEKIVSLQTTMESISQDLESREQFQIIRSQCKAVFSDAVMQKFEESLGIDSRGLDAGEYVFPQTTSRMVAMVISYKERFMSLSKKVEEFRKRLRQSAAQDNGG
ncbi:MAG: hypothetical protein KBC47_00895 [Candidatus Peribacteraceae bacterium]|nr:hypothetical protein [Candidatus Peribacteraceae bacterium]